MNYSEINEKILETYIKCDIKSFPLNCYEVIENMGYNLYKYSELPNKKRNSCLMVSDESFKLHDNIYYNDRMIDSRIRFSLAHELGHIILGHGDYQNSTHETQANYFASHFLAPRMAIHYSNCKNYVDVSKLFDISYEAAQYAFDDYRRWHRKTIYHKMTPFDKTLYSHFHDKGQDKFIYNKKECIHCERKIYNTQSAICGPCNVSYRYRHRYTPQQDMDFLIAESNWLYGGL